MQPLPLLRRDAAGRPGRDREGLRAAGADGAEPLPPLPGGARAPGNRAAAGDARRGDRGRRRVGVGPAHARRAHLPPLRRDQAAGMGRVPGAGHPVRDRELPPDPLSGGTAAEPMATLHVLRVFADEAGEWGNPLGVFLDGSEVPAGRRQAVAAELGFSETVFVDDRTSGACRIFTPGSELGFAGHPCVGTAWLLEREGDAVEALRPPAGEVAVRTEGELTFIAARPE